MQRREEVPTVFLRKATGLVRQIGLFTAILITLTYTIGAGWQRRVFQFSKVPVPENQYLWGINPMVMAFIVIGIIVLLAVYTFGIVTAAMPRSGGGYVVISRVLHPYLGYTSTWFWYLATAVAYGQIGVIVIEVPAVIFPQLFGLQGNILVSASTPSELATAEGLVLLLGVVVVIIFGIIALFGVRLAGLLLQVLFVIPAALTVLVYALLLSANAGSINSGLQGLYNTSPEAVTRWALAHNMDANSGTYGLAFGTATLGAYWAYEGYAATTFVAGEVKEANRNLPRSLVLAGVVIVAVYVSASALLYRATSMVGNDPSYADVGGHHYSFFSAWAYTGWGGGALGDFNTANNATLPKPWMPLAAAAQAQGAGFASFVPLLGIFALFWVMNDIPPFILTASRALFAMSFDRTLPAKFSDVSERWHSPTWAILFTMIVGVFGALTEAEGDFTYIGPNVNAFLGNILGTGVATVDLWDMAFFALFSLAAALLPFIRKDIYETSPYKPRIGPLPIITLTGFLSFIGHMYLMWIMLWNPSGYALNGDTFALTGNDLLIALSTTLATVGLLVFFSILYVVYTYRGKAKGTDFRTIYTEIPPE